MYTHLFKYIFLFVLLFPLGAMSQIYPGNEEAKKNSTEISIKVNFNEMKTNRTYYDCIEEEEPYLDSNCFVTGAKPYGPAYFNGSLGIDVKKYYGYRGSGNLKYYRYGVEFQPEFFYNAESDYFRMKYNFMPYFGIGNTNNFESRIGVFVGDFFGTGGIDINTVNIRNNGTLWVSFYQRIGNSKGFHGVISLFNSPAAGLSASSIHGSLNYKFKKNRLGPLSQLTIGLLPLFISAANEEAFSLYLETTFSFEKGWLLSPRFGATGLLPPGFGSGFSDNNSIGFFYGVGLKYSFESGGKKGRSR